MEEIPGEVYHEGHVTHPGHVYDDHYVDGEQQENFGHYDLFQVGF